MRKFLIMSLVASSLFADIAINEIDLIGKWYIKTNKGIALEFMQAAGNLFDFELLKNNKARKKLNAGFSNYSWKIVNNNIVKLKYITGSSFNIGDFILESKYKSEFKIINKINSYCYDVIINNSVKGKMCNSKEAFKYIGENFNKNRKKLLLK